jgi:hypothetical protein
VEKVPIRTDKSTTHVKFFLLVLRPKKKGASPAEASDAPFNFTNCTKEEQIEKRRKNLSGS